MGNIIKRINIIITLSTILILPTLFLINKKGDKLLNINANIIKHIKIQYGAGPFKEADDVYINKSETIKEIVTHVNSYRYKKKMSGGFEGNNYNVYFYGEDDQIIYTLEPHENLIVVNDVSYTLVNTDTNERDYFYSFRDYTEE